MRAWWISLLGLVVWSSPLWSATPLSEEARQTCDFLQQGEGFAELEPDPAWKQLNVRYQFDEQTGSCGLAGLELKMDSWQQSLVGNLLQGLSQYYGARFSPDFWDLTQWVHEEQPQTRIQLYRNQEFSFSVIPDEEGHPGVLLQFTTRPGDFLDH